MIANAPAVQATGAALIGLTIGATVTIAADAPRGVRQALSAALTLPNPAYTEAERHGRGTRDLEPWLRYYDTRDDGTTDVPRGAAEMVHRICLAHDLRPIWRDETYITVPVPFDERVTLSPVQERAVAETLQRRVGVLEAPAGSGKTVMGLALVARRRQPALWITHTRELARQAVERAGMVLGLSADEVGFVGDGECRVGARLTVALVQTLARGIPPALLDVGHVVVDEAHHCPALQMAAVIARFDARYILGLTATPYRRDGLDAVIRFYLGPTVARIAAADLSDRLILPRVIKRDTGMRPQGDSFTEIVSELVADPARNALIVRDVVEAVGRGRRCLVLSDRVDHVETLTALLQAEAVRAAVLHGRLGKRTRGQVVEDLAAGALDVAVATGSLVGEGFDCPRLDALFLATPVSYSGRVVQYIGRVSRTAPGKVDALVFDYCDDHRMLWSTYRNRAAVYREQQRVAA